MTEATNPQKKWDMVELFIRADERTQGVEAEQQTLRLAVENIKNNQEKLEGRVNFGVAKTGQENSTDIAALNTKVALLDRENSELKKQLFDEDTGVIKQFEDLRTWVSTVNKTVIGFFITGVCGALILWGFKNFR